KPNVSPKRRKRNARRKPQPRKKSNVSPRRPRRNKGKRRQGKRPCGLRKKNAPPNSANSLLFRKRTASAKRASRKSNGLRGFATATKMPSSNSRARDKRRLSRSAARKRRARL